LAGRNESANHWENCNLSFCSTKLSKENLLNEGVEENRIIVTGNTVIDALHLVVERIKNDITLQEELKGILSLSGYNIERLSKGRKLVLITGHRRENFGEGFLQICNAI
jgi:UDP-N-acetylglucosamine 2-epimerase (non-hydrolysing)